MRDQRRLAPAVQQPLRETRPRPSRSGRAAPRPRPRAGRGRRRARSGGTSPSSPPPTPSTTRASNSISRRVHLADAARQQPGGAAVGREAAIDERLPEAGVVGGDGEVGGQREVEPDARRPSPARRHTTGVCVLSMSGMSRWACDGRRRWMLPTRGRGAVVGVAGDDVEPGAEVVAGAGDHDDAHRFVAGRRRRSTSISAATIASVSALRLSGRSRCRRSTPSSCEMFEVDHAASRTPRCDRGRAPARGSSRRRADRAGAPGRARGSAAGSWRGPAW